MRPSSGFQSLEGQAAFFIALTLTLQMLEGPSVAATTESDLKERR
jgi:hypothetical protein